MSVFHPQAIAIAGVLCAAVAVPLRAEGPISVRVQNLFYADDTEYKHNFLPTEPDTNFGTAGRLFLEAKASDKVALRAGVFVNQRFGSDSSFEEVRPVISLIVGSEANHFVLGTLETVRRSDGPGPDLTTPHGLIPPIQREILSFTRNNELGLQWVLNKDSIKNEAWVHWEVAVLPGRREVFNVGTAGRVKVSGPLWIGAQFQEVHQGGELAHIGAVSDSLAWGGGLVLDSKLGWLDRGMAEAYGIKSRDNPDRSVGQVTNGSGLFVRLAGTKGAWRAHGIYWTGTSYTKQEGDPNYFSWHADGLTIGGARDYEELGLTRSAAVIPGVGLEGSFRLHRILSHVDYSFRVLGTVNLGWRLFH